MTSGHHGPYGQGYTRATMARTEGCQLARVSQSLKTRRSPDRSLQLDSVKSESLVIANQNVAVNTFPGLVHTVGRRLCTLVCSVQKRMFHPDEAFLSDHWVRFAL